MNKCTACRAPAVGGGAVRGIGRQRAPLQQRGQHALARQVGHQVLGRLQDAQVRGALRPPRRALRSSAGRSSSVTGQRHCVLQGCV